MISACNENNNDLNQNPADSAEVKEIKQ